MIEDENGWHDAPAGKNWLCPDCNKVSPIKDWQETYVDCDLCGDHSARECPLCYSTFELVWGSEKIKSGDK